MEQKEKVNITNVIKGKGVLLALIALVLFFSLSAKHFAKPSNLINILRQISLLGIICMSSTMVITTGEIDLSVGAVYCLSAIVSGMLMVSGVSICVSVLVALLIGSLIGVLNGVLVAYVKIPAMIVTLGMMDIARGIALIITDGRIINVSVRTISNPFLCNFIFLGQGKILNIPVMTLIFLIITLITGILYHKSLFGFHLKAVGGNANAARVSGINDKKIKVMAFGFNGLYSALAGLLNISFLSNIQGTSGNGMEMNVIAAVIIGGTSLSGGEGTIIGTLIGVLIIGVLNNGIIMMRISPFFQTLIIGIVIIGAVALDTLSKKRGK